MGDFEITVPGGPMVCGYCGEIERWEEVPKAPEVLLLSYVKLTGFHSIGVGPEGELVVLAEAEWLNGQIDHLPHLCAKIPDSIREEYASEIAEILANRT